MTKRTWFLVVVLVLGVSSMIFLATTSPCGDEEIGALRAEVAIIEAKITAERWAGLDPELTKILIESDSLFRELRVGLDPELEKVRKGCKGGSSSGLNRQAFKHKALHRAAANLSADHAFKDTNKDRNLTLLYREEAILHRRLAERYTELAGLAKDI